MWSQLNNNKRLSIEEHTNERVSVLILHTLKYFNKKTLIKFCSLRHFCVFIGRNFNSSMLG